MGNLRAIKEKRDDCLQEIARRTPPRNHHEVIMIEAYQRLLDDIDFSLQLTEMSATEPNPSAIRNRDW